MSVLGGSLLTFHYRCRLIGSGLAQPTLAAQTHHHFDEKADEVWGYALSKANFRQ
jgi:hypothetical protein